MNKSQSHSKSQSTQKNILRAILIFTPVVLIVLTAIFFDTIRDFALSLSYASTPETSSVESSLGLTSYGSLVYRASHPQITDDYSTFRDTCYDGQDPTSVSIQGCFVRDEIHIYNITSPELSGIVESTTAHELLHAVWSRLSDSEKSSLTPVLEELKSSADEDFLETLTSYEDADVLEETYVRSATQIRDLPPVLESHFARIFTNQDAIVAFYDSYQNSFSLAKKELDSLSKTLKSLKSEIDSLAEKYLSDVSALNSDISAFNDCANTAGCFSAVEFYSQRSALEAREASLTDIYNYINDRISLYNSHIETYNNNILHIHMLETTINPELEPINL